MSGVYDPPYPIPYNPIRGTTSAPAGVMTVYNVKDYGAYGDGVHDDGPAWNDAISAAQTAGGGIVYGVGTFLINTPVVTAKGGAYVHIMGGGEGVTKFVTGPSIASGGYTVSLLSSGGVSDATFDSNGLAPCPLLVGNETQTTTKLTQFASRITATNCTGSWNAVFWDLTQTYMVDQLTLDDVTILGPSNTSGDAFAVSYVNVCQVSRMKLIGLVRTPNFYVINYLQADDIYSDGGGTAAGGVGVLVIDAGVKYAEISNLTVDNTTSTNPGSMIVNTPSLQAVNWTLISSEWGIGIGAGAGNQSGNDWTFINCHLSNGLGFNQPMTRLLLVNSYLLATSAGQIIQDASAAGSVSTDIHIVNSVLDAGPFNYKLAESTNGTSWSRFSITGGSLVRGGSVVFSGLTFTNGTRISGVNGYNPVGSAVPGSAFALPASGTAWTNNTGVDGTLYVTAAGTVTDVVVQGVTVGSSLAVGQQFHIPAGGTFTLTYSAAPTLIFVGN